MARVIGSIVLVILVCFLMSAVAAGFLFRFTLVRPRRKKEKIKEPAVGAQPAAAAVAAPGKDIPAIIEAKRRWLLEQPLERVEITSIDGLTLRALFWPAEGQTGKTVLCIHGYHNEGAREFGIYARFYHERGYHLLIPDDRAHGRSEGRYIGFGYLDRLDCIGWCAYLDRRFGAQSEILLHGISMGCATVTMASGEAGLPDSVRGVIADCGYTSALDELGHELRTLFHLPRFPILYLASGICRIFAGYTFRQCDAVEMVKRARVPFLFIHGGADSFVPTRMGKVLYDACPTEKELLIVAGAGHAKSFLVDPQIWQETVVRFLKRIGF